MYELDSEGNGRSSPREKDKYEPAPVNNDDNEFPESLRIEVCRMVLEPVVGILLRIGMPFSAFSRIARNVYVDVAASAFGKRGRHANNSRIAMLTGLSRTRVREELRLLSQAAGNTSATEDKVRPASRVLLGWHTDARFSSSDGRPADLSGEQFRELYDTFSGKVVPMTAMLKELLNVGAVEMTDEGRLRVLTRSFMPRTTDPAALRRVAMAIRDLAQTGSHNLFRPDEQRTRFERFATNQLVPASEADAFRDFLEAEGQAFLERVDDWLAERECADGEEQSIRMGVGVYQISPGSDNSKR